MKKIIIFTLIFTLMFVSLVNAAASGEIKGRVTINGKAIEKATVILIDDNMRTTIQETNKEGYYSFKNLENGRYVITVKVNGKFYINYKIKK